MEVVEIAKDTAIEVTPKVDESVESEEEEIEERDEKESCLNCEAEMTPDHQCKSGGEESETESVQVEDVLVPPRTVYLCYNCDGEGHFARECPFEKPKYFCYHCGGEGHFARDCVQ